MTSVKKKTSGIKRRKSTSLSKLVKTVKAHEKKYTFLLVMFFFLLFVVIGYFTLRVR